MPLLRLPKVRAQRAHRRNFLVHVRTFLELGPGLCVSASGLERDAPRATVRATAPCMVDISPPLVSIPTGAERHPIRTTDKWAGGAASPAVTIPIPLPRV